MSAAGERLVVVDGQPAEQWAELGKEDRRQGGGRCVPAKEKHPRTSPYHVLSVPTTSELKIPLPLEFTTP